MTAAEIHANVTALRGLFAPTVAERLETMRRGLVAAQDRLGALHRHRHTLGAEALVQQFSGLHREAQRLAHQLAAEDGGPANAA